MVSIHQDCCGSTSQYKLFLFLSLHVQLNIADNIYHLLTFHEYEQCRLLSIYSLTNILLFTLAAICVLNISHLPPTCTLESYAEHIKRLNIQIG